MLNGFGCKIIDSLALLFPVLPFFLSDERNRLLGLRGMPLRRSQMVFGEFEVLITNTLCRTRQITNHVVN